MRRTFQADPSRLSEDWTSRHLRTMLIGAKRDLSTDSIQVEEYADTNLTDLTATVDPGELLARGKVSYWYETLDGRQEKSTHSFEIRDSDGLEVTITDHAFVL
jgi:hypothetical protein